MVLAVCSYQVPGPLWRPTHPYLVWWPLDEPVGIEMFSSAMMVGIKPMVDPCLLLAWHL